MSELKRSYYSITPANVRYDKKLPLGARFLYGEITALSNEKGYCWATNAYFAELYEVSKDTISRWISSLSKQGYIKISLQYKNGTREIANRYIYICSEGIGKINDTPIGKKAEDNITVKNNTSNNTLEYIPDSTNPVILPFSELVDITPEKPKQEKERDTIRDYLNERYISEVKVFANPAKENASLKKISSAIKAKSNAEDIDPLDAAKKLCDTQYALYKSGQAFWSEFTPSRLVYAFESAWAMMKKGHTSISSPNCRAKTLSDDECLRVDG